MYGSVISINGGKYTCKFHRILSFSKANVIPLADTGGIFFFFFFFFFALVVSK